MKILWVCNCKPSGLEEDSASNGGGWMTGILSQMTKMCDWSFYIVYPSSDTSCVKQNGQVCIQSLKSNGNPLAYNKIFCDGIKKLITEKSFDCVHIWGTEFPHSLATADACQDCKMEQKTLIWIQGLCSIIAEHYYADLPPGAFHTLSFRDFVKGDTLKEQKRKFEIRGEFEKKAIKKVRHICGRTDLDRIMTNEINPNATYHFCNEILRSEFYGESWDLNNCQRGRIFTSQADYPIKGLHKLLEAVYNLRKKYSFIELYIAGDDITSKDILRMGTYARYITKYIKKHKMEDYVHFTGRLTACEMIEQYKLANIFVLPSSVENSPNSLGEAMLIGTPSVASDVGGVPNMLTHNKDGFVYPFNENNKLAFYIEEIINNDSLALSFSQASREHAAKTHNREENAEKLMKIYEEIRGN